VWQAGVSWLAWSRDFIISKLIGQIDNYLVETTLTTVLAYGSYLAAEYVLGSAACWRWWLLGGSRPNGA